ncbi:hypothetical protein CFP56_034892 [Quercus suber]|uniref:Uncharacterized protein n=1 Tax=Quercus suber TaxID=58331 RepID=A0AAW0JBP0_QUESU
MGRRNPRQFHFSSFSHLQIPLMLHR